MPTVSTNKWLDNNTIVAEAKAWHERVIVQPAKTKRDSAASDVSKFDNVTLWQKILGKFQDGAPAPENGKGLKFGILVIAAMLVCSFTSEDHIGRVSFLIMAALFALVMVVGAVLNLRQFNLSRAHAYTRWSELSQAIPRDPIETVVQKYLDAMLMPELDYFRTTDLAMVRDRACLNLTQSLGANGRSSAEAQAVMASISSWRGATNARYAQAEALQAAIAAAAAIVREEAVAVRPVAEDDFDSERLPERLTRLRNEMNKVRDILANANAASQVAAGEGGLEAAIVDTSWQFVAGRV